MRIRRRRRATWTIALIVAAAFVLAACASSAETRGASPGDGDAAGPPTGAGDAGAGSDAPDAGTAPDGIPTDEAGGYFPGAGEAEDPGRAGDIDTCFDGENNDADVDDLIDCDDAGCQSLPSCCVANADCCAALTAEASPLPSALDFEGCGDNPDPCLAGTIPFGNPAPWFREGALYPGGDETFDSGLRIGEPMDLTAVRIDVGARFGAPEGCSSTCLEGAGLALTTQQDLGDTSDVRPLVGLLLSGSRQEVSLVVADETVRSWALEGNEERWGLTAAPTGEVRVLRGDARTEVARAVFAPTRSAQLVAYGRSRNPRPDAPSGARLEALRMTVSQCDMPFSWSTREPLTVVEPPLPDALESGRRESPSLARDGTGEVRLVFEQDDAFHFARRSDPPSRFTLLHPAGEPALTPGRPHDAGGIDDPELVWDGSTWVVLYTAEGTDGTRRIGRARWDAERGVFEADGSEMPLPLGTLAGLEMPAYVRLARGIELIVARGSLPGGGHQLVAFWSNGGTTWSRLEGGGLEGLTSRGTGRSDQRFDADEVASPDLIVQNDAYHLYYAGRRGTRWRIGLLASDDLIHWRVVDWDTMGEDAILSGDGEGFDRVGVRDPDVLSNDGGVELVYAGSDGARTTLGRVTRPLPERREWQP